MTAAELDDRVAIVTGAGSGIGAAIARTLAAHGMTVALVARREDTLDAVAQEIADAGTGSAIVVPADLAHAEVHQEIVDRVLDETGRLDVVVNNAGAFKLGPVVDFPLEHLDLLLAVNIRSPFLLIQAAIPALRRSPAAAIVNISSASAGVYRSGQTGYGLSKAAIEHMTKNMAAELAPDGIRVNCVRPGPIATPIHAQAVDDVDAFYAKLGPLVPLGRVGQPEEIARWVWQLVSPESGFVTGATIAVDGGRSLGPPERALRTS